MGPCWVIYVCWMGGWRDGWWWLASWGFWAGQGSSVIGLWRCCSASGSASEQRDFGPEVENLTLLVAIGDLGMQELGFWQVM